MERKAIHADIWRVAYLVKGAHTRLGKGDILSKVAKNSENCMWNIW